MDGLWDPPNYQAAEDSDSFSVAYDVLEETALYEKSCIQVLKILISKANTDIIELEEELMDLLIQLACTDEVFSDMLCMSLRVKIDFLSLSIQRLKDDAGDFLSTSREPAESIHDILKSLFCRYLQKKDLQFADNTCNVSSSYIQVRAENPSEQKKRTGSSSNARQIENSQRAIIMPVEKNTVPKTIKIEEENAKYTSTWPVPKCTALSLCWASTKKMDREVNKFQIKSPVITKDIIQNSCTRYKSICRKPSLETQEKWNNQLIMIKSQMDDEHIDSTSIPLIESSEEASAKQIITRDPDLSPGYSNPQDHQQQSVSLSVSRYSTRAHKRRQKLNSSMQTGSNSLCLLEGPKPLSSSLALAVARPLETYSNLGMDYFTVDQLKVIAKERKIKGYYKLRKSELAEALGIKFIEGKRKPKRKEKLQLAKMQGEP